MEQPWYKFEEDFDIENYVIPETFIPEVFIKNNFYGDIYNVVDKKFRKTIWDVLFNNTSELVSQRGVKDLSPTRSIMRQFGQDYLFNVDRSNILNDTIIYSLVINYRKKYNKKYFSKRKSSLYLLKTKFEDYYLIDNSHKDYTTSGNNNNSLFFRIPSNIDIKSLFDSEYFENKVIDLLRRTKSIVSRETTNEMNKNISLQVEVGNLYIFNGYNIKNYDDFFNQIEIEYNIEKDVLLDLKYKFIDLLKKFIIRFGKLYNYDLQNEIIGTMERTKQRNIENILSTSKNIYPLRKRYFEYFKGVNDPYDNHLKEFFDIFKEVEELDQTRQPKQIIIDKIFELSSYLSVIFNDPCEFSDNISNFILIFSRLYISYKSVMKEDVDRLFKTELYEIFKDLEFNEEDFINNTGYDFYLDDSIIPSYLKFDIAIDIYLYNLNEEEDLLENFIKFAFYWHKEYINEITQYLNIKQTEQGLYIIENELEENDLYYGESMLKSLLKGIKKHVRKPEMMYKYFFQFFELPIFQGTLFQDIFNGEVVRANTWAFLISDISKYYSYLEDVPNSFNEEIFGDIPISSGYSYLDNISSSSGYSYSDDISSFTEDSYSTSSDEENSSTSDEDNFDEFYQSLITSGVLRDTFPKYIKEIVKYFKARLESPSAKEKFNLIDKTFLVLNVNLINKIKTQDNELYYKLVKYKFELDKLILSMNNYLPKSKEQVKMDRKQSFIFYFD